MIKLIGILIIIVGFIFRVDTLLTVLVAGILTGLISGMDIMSILDTMGKAFVDNRSMSLFVLTLPAIGLAEKHGLKEQAARLIGSIRAATAGRVMSIYLVLRTIIAGLGLRLGGHPQFIRPLIAPMAEGAIKAKYGVDELPEDLYEDVMGLAASSENYGNFYGQNIFIAASGLLLIQGVFKEAGISVDLMVMSRYAIPVGIMAVIYGVIQYYFFDKKIEKRMEGVKGNAAKPSKS
ncbi:DUF969 domain-containing protein [Calorimonas adulescens]|jgi:Protein of unknown function (DUF969).|uniref:DUF969 domain-containing protein n=1 Tax=Calorimonas adulescens TaxID=2606906 RepID=A0A5D8QCZ0_9THEO|nr:DUF969 domain-containing protein [Calorimonas adulescens]TZE82401.1 DUF969 domain-containing protein [Calorimonas adulescens]